MARQGRHSGLEPPADHPGGDFLFVTDNRRDFVRLYRNLDIHNGLIIILPSVDLDEQVRLFNLALTAVQELGDTLNMLIEVDGAGEVAITEWPERSV